MHLHNDISIELKDATPAQLLSSIGWYSRMLVKHSGEDFTKLLRKDWRNSLAKCKAAYADKIGKKKKK